MKLEEILKFINDEDIRIKDHYKDHDTDPMKRILYRAVKLGEEVGEFYDAILSSDNSQRDEKLQNYDKNNLSEEFADVILAAMLLAKSSNINIEEALEGRINKIKNRSYK